MRTLLAVAAMTAVAAFALERNKIDPDKVIPETTLVPSGVAEVSRLQFKEGFAYLRP